MRWRSFEPRKISLGVDDLVRTLEVIQELAYELNAIAERADDIRLEDVMEKFDDVGQIAVTIEKCVANGAEVEVKLNQTLENQAAEIEELKDQVQTLQAQLLGLLPIE